MVQTEAVWNRSHQVEHFRQALTPCGSPSWIFKQVRERLKCKDLTVKDRKNEEGESLIKTMVTIPYVKDPIAYVCTLTQTFFFLVTF